MNISAVMVTDDSAKKRRPGRRLAPDAAQEDENSLYSIIRQGKAGLQVNFLLQLVDICANFPLFL
jgi:hypothetical protein